jgi:hypothetical protein
MRCFARLSLFFGLHALFVACPRTLPPECKDFFDSDSPQKELFLSYPLDKQIRIYKCGMNQHPQARYLASYIARKGETVIPPLLENLENEKSELDQQMVITIFENISMRGYLKNKPEVLGRISAVINRMKIPIVKEMAQESEKRILEYNQGNYPRANDPDR